MKNLTKRIQHTAAWVALLLPLLCIYSCKREYINYSTTSDVNIYSYLEQHSDEFSLFKQIVDKAGYGSFINTYGTYTLFAANNDGVNAYLKATNRASVDNIDAATAKKIVSISLLADTIGTQLFTDGKMRSPTTSGQFLLTGVSSLGGVSRLSVNRQASLVRGNIRLGNGIIHVIDNVLTPAELTLAKMIEQNPDYSIFSEALKATGFYDTLNVASSDQKDTTRKYLTLIAQTNAVFSAAGIPDFNTLRTKYSTKGNPKDHADSLYLFVAYRVFPELSYLSDIVAASSHQTLAPLEITTSMLDGERVLLNNDVFNGVLEPGVALDRTKSDNSASNGVLHAASANYKIKVRKATAVFFDLGDQPEIRKAPGVYRSLGKTPVPFALGSLKDVTWNFRGTNGANFYYGTTAAIPTETDWYFGNDWVQFGTRFRTGNDGMSDITFTTPLLVKGRYKVWVDFKRVSGTVPIVVSFDGQTLANSFIPAESVSITESDALLETKNLKRYTESPTLAGQKDYVSKMVGIINVTTTDRHKITFTVTGAGGLFQMDAVEFRPVDMPSQIYPKLGRDGTLKY